MLLNWQSPKHLIETFDVKSGSRFQCRQVNAGSIASPVDTLHGDLVQLLSLPIIAFVGSASCTAIQRSAIASTVNKVQFIVVVF